MGFLWVTAPFIAIGVLGLGVNAWLAWQNHKRR